MTRVLFLAQNPFSAQEDHPLSGRAKKTFDMWLRMLGSPDHLILNASRKPGPITWKDFDAVTVAAAVSECDRFVALGAYASGLLERLGVSHFTLPLPTRTKQTALQRADLTCQLRLCRIYVRSNTK